MPRNCKMLLPLTSPKPRLKNNFFTNMFFPLDSCIPRIHSLIDSLLCKNILDPKLADKIAPFLFFFFYDFSEKLDLFYL